MLFANHERAYATGNFKVIAGNLLVPNGGASRLEYLTEKFTKAKPLELIKAISAYPSKEKGSILVAGYDNGINILRASLADGSSAYISSYHPQEKDVSITLRDPMSLLMHCVKDITSLGVVTKQGTRLLEEGSGDFHKDLSAKYFHKLQEAFNAKDAKRANKIVDAYVNEDFCAIDRTIYHITDGLKRLFAPLIHTKVKRTEEETRTKDILASKNEYSSAIISLRDGLSEAEKEDLAGKVSHEYGLRCDALFTSPTLVLKGDKNDVEKVSARFLNAKTSLSNAMTGIRPAKMKVAKLPKPKAIIAEAPSKFPHVALLNAYQAHAFTQGENVTGAVMDTGVDYTHSWLKDNFDEDKGYDFVENTQTPYDKEGHGTHVAGIWKAVAPRVNLKSVRVLDSLGRGAEADILLGYEYCYKNGIPIINCSFGSNWASEQERRVVEAAADYGCIIVAASGNESDENSDDIVSYPAAFRGVQSIASVNASGRHSPFSNMGYVTFAAMGEDVLSSLPGNKWATMDGTSMASPGAAGALTLQLAAHPEFSLDDRLMLAHELCTTNGKGEEWERRYGFGIPDCGLYVGSDELWIGALKSVTKMQNLFASLSETTDSRLTKESASLWKKSSTPLRTGKK